MMVNILVIFVFCMMFMKSTLGGSLCSNCYGNNVTCVDGECLPRCVNVTSSGECLQCRDSKFYGKDCERDCPNTCLNSRCQMNNSRALCTEGCVAGKKGGSCGVDCLRGCTRCYRYGDICEGHCQMGYYGEQCQNPCSHKCEGGCVKSKGICNRCKQGYLGNYCDSPCPSVCRVSGECAECSFTNEIQGASCTKECPHNCTICIGTLVIPDATKGVVFGSTTLKTPTESNETLKILCAVLATMLSTVAVVFIYKKCTKYRREVRSRIPHNHLPAKARYSTEHSASGQYISSKYWEIHDEDLDSTLEDKHVVCEQDIPAERLPPAEHENVGEVRGVRHPPASQDRHLPCSVKTDELTLRCPSEKRARSWNCERHEPKRVVTIPRPYSDASASGQTIPHRTDMYLPSRSSEKVPFIKFDQTFDMTNITVKYLTTNVNETHC